MSHLGYFVTGTDTEVGKTLVSCALLYLLGQKYSKVSGFKPVAAGMRDIDGHWANEDLLALQQVSFSQDICPYPLHEAIAPHLAAKHQHIELDYQVILQAYRSIQAQSEVVVVEGVGGFCVPFDESTTSADFASDCQLPLILVVGMKLGCINHALLTVEAIQQRGLQLSGWVANSMGTPMQCLDENIATLTSLLPAPRLGIIPVLNPSQAQTPYRLATIEKVSSYLKLP